MGFFKQLIISEEKEEPVAEYTVRTRCLNCKTKKLYNIERGKIASEELKKLKCGYCGVAQLVQGDNEFFDDILSQIQSEEVVDVQTT